MNLLQKVTAILLPRGREVLAEIHQKIITDEAVVKAKLCPSLEDLRLFYEIARLGLVYAKQTYGPTTIPESMFFQSAVRMPDGAINSDLICYRSSAALAIDEIIISRFHFASHAAQFNSDVCFKDYHLPPHQVVRAEHHLLLQIIEECYHRFQVHRGMRPTTTQQGIPMTDQNDPLEIEIKQVMARAIENLCLPTFEPAS